MHKVLVRYPRSQLTYESHTDSQTDRQADTDTHTYNCTSKDTPIEPFDQSLHVLPSSHLWEDWGSVVQQTLSAALTSQVLTVPQEGSTSFHQR